MDLKKQAKRFWHFIVEEDTPASWIANIILAFILIKFVIYPVLGLVFATTHPVVAVVSGSMEHDGTFNDWWLTQCPQGRQEDLYRPHQIDAETFMTYPFAHGFNKGDIMVLTGYGTLQKGDVIVFNVAGREPIIHRIISTTTQGEERIYQTKGDNNCGSAAFENNIKDNQIIGHAVLRIPLLGWVKLGFTNLVNMLW